MSVISHTEAEVKLLARLMRAEAESDGKKGMLCVGNVCVNRAIANCLDFKKINTIEKAVMQSPGGFEATQKSYFYQAARAVDIKLARRVLAGERFSPATKALWFYNSFGEPCRSQWWGQWNSGKYKSHCFYQPLDSENCY
ncbi:MAG: cell wall hydrolase [Acholeplasmatales bacterium]|nr:cell wall hydrolase [Acholeplasmatales bacterium]